MSHRSLPLEYGLGTRDAVDKIEKDAGREVPPFGKPSFSGGKHVKGKVGRKTNLRDKRPK